MKIVVVGGGRVGDALVKYLSQEGHDIVVVDSNQAIIENIGVKYDVNCICGNGAIKEILLAAGANTADIIIAATRQDELNIMCCQIGRLLGAKHSIARVRDPDYVEQLDFMKKKLGISMIFNPEQETASAIAQMLKYPSANKVEHFAKGRIGIVEFDVDENNMLCNRPIREVAGFFKKPVVICAILRNDELIIPTGNTIIEARDRLSVASTSVNLAAFFKDLKMFNQRAKSVMIIGGGNTAYYLARQLDEVGVSVKIIEKNMNRCLELSNLLGTSVNVICGDGSDKQVLDEEGLKSSDAVTVMTDSDEQNIIISMFCNQARIRQVICRMTNYSYSSILEEIDMDSVISPHLVVAQQIIRYARALSAPAHECILTLYKMADERAEALEFEIPENFPSVNEKLRDIKFKKNLLIVGIIRGKQTVIPDGNTELLIGDHIIIVTADNRFTSVEDILEL